MTRRYFVPDLPVRGGGVALPEAEAQHATRVMRIQVGQPITLFDGQGHEAEATVVHVHRNECLCEAEAATAIDREPSLQLHLAVALPKPDRARELIERLTELGVRSLTPLVAARTQRPPAGKLIAKLQRGVIEACKQSGRNELLQIHDPQDTAQFFQSEPPGARVIADVDPNAQRLDCVRQQPVVTAAIGPEGGWSEQERQVAAAHGFRSVQLGQRIYRIETAATVIAAVLVTP